MRRIHIMTLQALALIAFGGCAEHALPSLAQAETLLSQVQATERGIAGTCVNNHETSPAPETFSRLRQAGPADIVAVHRPPYLNDPADVELLLKVRDVHALHLSVVVRVRGSQCESFSLSEIWN
jgi:hypothetical protein